MKKVLFALFAVMATIALQAQDYRFNTEPNGFSIQNSDRNQLTIRHNLSAITIEDANRSEVQGQVITLSGIHLSNEAGAPNLPSSSAFVAIPNGSQPSLKLVNAKTKTIQDVDLIPAPQPQLDNDDAVVVYEKDMDIYSRNAFYPETPYQISRVLTVRGVEMVQVGVMPFQYNPVTKELIVYEDMELELSTEGGDDTYGDLRYRTPEWDHILSDMLLNRTVLPAVDYGERLRKHYENRETGCEYMIITPDNEEFVQLADSIRLFRTKQGVPTEVFTVTECGGNTYQALRNFIRNAYNTWDMPPAAVLILGDHNSDPTQGVVSYTMNNHPGGGGYNPYISDHAYSDMTGNKLSDIIVGRITGRNYEELYHMIKKDLDYERNPPTSPNFYDEPVTAMGFQLERWFQLCSEIVNGFWEYSLGKHPVRINAIYQGTPGSRWSTYEYTNQVINYFGPNGCCYIPSTMSHLTDWSGTGSKVNEAINNGAFIVQHRDHGAEELWGEPSYNIGKIQKLTNKDLTYVMSNNCLTGRFNYNGENGCFAEAFHRHQYGALGLIAATQVSYSFVNDVYVWGAYDNMWPEFMPTYGTTHATRFLHPAFANAAGKYFLSQSSWTDDDVKEITYYLFHQHGDAYMNLYSEVPQPLEIEMLPILVAGSDHYEIMVEEDATICISVGGQIIGFDYGTGMPQNITVTPQEAGAIATLTVTKQDRYRYEHQLVTIPNEGPYLIFNEIQFIDASGNSQENPNYLETYQLNVSLHNVGFATIDEVKVSLTCANPNVELLQAETIFDKIEAHGITIKDNAFSVRFNNDFNDGEKVRFYLTMENDGYRFMDSIDFIVNAPDLHLTNYYMTDTQGDTVDRLTKGETSYLYYEIANQGHSKSQTIQPSLQMIAPFIQTHVETPSLEGIQAGETASAIFRIDVADDATDGCLIDYLCQAISGYHSIQIQDNMPLGFTTEDFEGETLNPNMDWSLGSGNNLWYVVEDAGSIGGHCLRSPEMGDGKSSSFMIGIVTPQEGKFSFYRKISTDAGDVLTLKTNGANVKTWEGESDWEKEEFDIKAGTHVIIFTYKKNAHGSAGDDCVKLDELTFPPLADVIFYPGKDTPVCRNEDAFTPESYAYNYQSIHWNTEGDGTFDDETLVRPTYYFGQEDYDEGLVALHMTAVSNYHGNEYTRTIQVNFMDDLSEIIPEKPVGDTAVDLKTTTQSTYQTGLVGDSYLLWQLQPTEAGTLEPAESTVTVTWNPDFRGIALLSYTLSNACGGSEPSEALSINVRNSSTTNELTYKLFNAYPNPAQDHVRIQACDLQSEQVVLSVVDNLGKVVYKMRPSTINGRMECTLSTAVLPSGIYHLLLTDGFESRSIRLVVR